MRGFRSTLILLAILGGLLGYIYFVDSKKPATPAGEEAKPKVFAVAAEKIIEVAVKTGAGENTLLRKNGNSWSIAQPVQAPADEAEVSGLTSAIAGADIQRVVDENPSDLNQYGLAEPRVEVAFRTADDKAAKHLLIGDKTPTGADLYAKLPNEKKVFLVPASLETSFNRSTFDLRDKSVLKFDRNSVDGVTVVAGSSSLQMAKTGEEWALTQPVKARADYGTVEGLVGRLQTAQMKSIVAADAKDLKMYGLDKPEITATVKAGSAESTLQIGKKTDDGNLYARDVSRPMIFSVEPVIADELRKPAGDFRRKDVFEFRAYNATRVEITRGTETFVFEKVKGQGKDAVEKWREVSPAAREVDSARMDALLTKLTNMRVLSWADPAAATGTDKPVLIVSTSFDEGKKQERVAFGKTASDVLAVRANEPGAAKIDSAEFDEALKALDALK